MILRQQRRDDEMQPEERREGGEDARADAAGDPVGRVGQARARGA